MHSSKVTPRGNRRDKSFWEGCLSLQITEIEYMANGKLKEFVKVITMNYSRLHLSVFTTVEVIIISIHKLSTPDQL